MSEIEIFAYARTTQIGPKFLSQISRNSKILPITFYAETLEDAVKKADKFWTDEILKMHGSVEAREQRIANLKKARLVRAEKKAKSND
jgi:hypothetical protein